MLNLYAKCGPLFASTSEELRRHTKVEATFRLEHGTRPIDRTPYRTCPLVEDSIDELVYQVLEK